MESMERRIDALERRSWQAPARCLFAVGEVVRLKSGSPKMTIAEFHAANGMVRCIWFSNEGETAGDVMEKYFPAEALEVAK